MFKKIEENIILDKLIDTFDLLCKCFVCNYDVIEDLDHVYLDHNVKTEDGNYFIYLLDTSRQYLGLGDKVLHYCTNKHYRYRIGEKVKIPVPVPMLTYEFNPNRPRFCKDSEDHYDEENISVEVPAIDRNFGRKISQIYFDKPDVFDKLLILYNRDSNFIHSHIHKYIDGYMTRIDIKETYEQLVKLKDTGKELFDITNDINASYGLNEKLISTIFSIDDSVFKNLINYDWLVRTFEDKLWNVLESLFNITINENITNNEKNSYTMIISKRNPDMFMTIEPMDTYLNLNKNNINVYRMGNETYGSYYSGSMETITNRYYAEYKPSLKLRIHHGSLSLGNSTIIDMFDPDCVEKIIRLINSYLKFKIDDEEITKKVEYLESCHSVYKVIKDLKQCCNLIINNSDYVRLEKKFHVSPDKNIMISLSDNEINSITKNTAIIFKKKVPGYHKNIETVYICDKQGNVKFRCKLACINYLRDMVQFSKDIKVHKVEEGVTKENVRKYFSGNYKALIFKEVKRMVTNGVETPITVEDFYLNKAPTTYQYIRSIKYNDKTNCIVEQELRENRCHRQQYDEV